jgi:hypothetical protein
MMSLGGEQKQENNSLLKLLLILTLPYIALGLIQSGFLSLLPFIRNEFIITRAQIGYYSTFSL